MEALSSRLLETETHMLITIHCESGLTDQASLKPLLHQHLPRASRSPLCVAHRGTESWATVLSPGAAGNGDRSGWTPRRVYQVHLQIQDPNPPRTVRRPSAPPSASLCGDE